MKEQNKKIGILDMNIDNIYVLNALRSKFKNDDLIYIFDSDVQTYEGLEVSEIEQRVKDNISFLLDQKIDILVVASDIIIEYCQDLLHELNIEIVLIVNETINYINNYYEHKNFGFLASSSILEANIYQKNFRYNHLYNMNADNLIDLLKNDLVKTSKSFYEVKNVVLPVLKKDLNIIIPSSINLVMLRTEFNEFLRDVLLIPLDEVIADRTYQKLYNDSLFTSKVKGKTIICVKEEVKHNKFLKFIKHKYLVLNTKTSKLIKK